MYQLYMEDMKQLKKLQFYPTLKDQAAGKSLTGNVWNRNTFYTAREL